MNRIANVLSRLVLGTPRLVAVMAILLTGVFGYVAATQAQFATGNEGFAPDNEELLAFETISERFNGTGESVVQVLVKGDDVISADGLRAVELIAEAAAASDAGEFLSETQERPAVVSWLGPLPQVLAEQGVDPAGADDATVDGAFADVLAELPPEQVGFMTGLLPDGVDPASQQSDSGLVLVFLRTEGMAPEGATDTEVFDAQIQTELSLADAIAEAGLPEGVTADAFSFGLLFGDQDEFQAEIGRLFSYAFLIIMVILGFVYWLRPGFGLRVVAGTRRTVADMLLTMLTIVMAILWMNGIGVLLGPGFLGWIGALNDVSQIVPVLLIGLGVDYAIHLTTRYREEVATGASVAEATSRAISTVGIALVLATVTTAVGFLTNIINPVPALKDFGVLAAVGILASFLLMLTFLPALRLLLDRRADRRGRLPREALSKTSERILPELMSRVAVLAERVPVATLIVTVVLGGALGAWGLSQLETRFSFTDFVPDDEPVVATYDEIIEDFGGGFGETTEVLVEGDVATPEMHNALVEVLDDLADVDDVAVFDGIAQAESPVRVLAMLLAPGPDGEAAPGAVADAAATAGLGPDLTVDPQADVAALYDSLFEAAPDAVERVLARDDAGTYDAARVGVQTSAGETRAGELREALAAAFAPIAAAGGAATPTSNEIISDVIITALSDSQMSSMFITLLAAMVLLVVTFWFRNRRPALGVLTVLPVGLVVLWTFAMMAATDIPFGPVTATIAALAIGIGVPYTIHITNRYQEDRLVYGDPAEAIRSTVRHTGGALAGSAFTTCAGFGILITSTLTPFRQLGLVTVYAVGFALLAATLVLPSLLELWDRWHRSRRVERAPVPEVAEV